MANLCGPARGFKTGQGERLDQGKEQGHFKQNFAIVKVPEVFYAAGVLRGREWALAGAFF